MPITLKVVEHHCMPAPEYDLLGSLDEVSLRMPQGVYTTFRTYAARSRVLGLQSHLDRLQHSAQLTGWSGVVDQEQVRSGVRTLLSRWAEGECRVRITLDLTMETGAIYLTAIALTLPAPEIYTVGVHVWFSHAQRTVPDIKNTGYILDTQEERINRPPDCYELLIQRHGLIMEGITSNFFGVIQGAVMTAGSGVLPGVTRRFVLDLARARGIPVELRPIGLAELPDLQEAFITSSSRGVVPVIQIAQQVIGNGTPGDITRQLGQDYDAQVSTLSEMI
jgi:branched-chain amino acid aminotransferase